MFVIKLTARIYGSLSTKPRARSDRSRKRDTVNDQAEGERREQPVERAGQAERQPATADRNYDAEESSHQRPEKSRGALGREIERHA